MIRYNDSVSYLSERPVKKPIDGNALSNKILNVAGKKIIERMKDILSVIDTEGSDVWVTFTGKPNKIDVNIKCDNQDIQDKFNKVLSDLRDKN